MSERGVKVSFEFFPPKSEAMEQGLWGALRRLSVLGPCFVSVTYGAGGSTRERTQRIVGQIVKETSLGVAAHLTCVGASCVETQGVARAYWAAGIRHIVALRGDMPDMGPYRPHAAGYVDTPAFITGLKEVAPFEVSVSAYPEKHPESRSFEADLHLLKRKERAGAVRAMTQFALDTQAYGRFYERLRGTDISLPVVPGIIITSNFEGLVRMAGKCGARVPEQMVHRYERCGTDPGARRALATEIAVEQCETLLQEGLSQFHFYTLNQADIVYDVCLALGMRPSTKAL